MSHDIIGYSVDLQRHQLCWSSISVVIWLLLLAAWHPPLVAFVTLQMRFVRRCVLLLTSHCVCVWRTSSKRWALVSLWRVWFTRAVCRSETGLLPYPLVKRPLLKVFKPTTHHVLCIFMLKMCKHLIRFMSQWNVSAVTSVIIADCLL